jgi:hypothetical protein
MSANLIHDKEANVWVWTDKVFTFPEQINNFKETYADYKNKEEWRELLRVFMFLQATWLGKRNCRKQRVC